MFWKVFGIVCGAAVVGGLVTGVVAGVVIKTKEHRRLSKAKPVTKKVEANA